MRRPVDRRPPPQRRRCRSGHFLRHQPMPLPGVAGRHPDRGWYLAEPWRVVARPSPRRHCRRLDLGAHRLLLPRRPGRCSTGDCTGAACSREAPGDAGGVHHRHRRRRRGLLQRLGGGRVQRAHGLQVHHQRRRPDPMQEPACADTSHPGDAKVRTCRGNNDY